MKINGEKYIGKILKRYKRFFADVELENGEVVTAHTPNTGSMRTCWEPGWKAMVTYHDNPKRKLKYTLEMTHNGKTWIGVNTSATNKIAKEAIELGLIKELNGYTSLQTEKKVGKSRIDLFLTYGEEECYIEVKNVTLSSKGDDTSSREAFEGFEDDSLALFPDAITTRGQKHLQELIDLKDSGIRAGMLYIVQREDLNAFAPADSVDHEYGRLLRRAREKGVEIFVYRCNVSPEEVIVQQSIPLLL